MAWAQTPAPVSQGAIDAEQATLATVTPTFGDGTNSFGSITGGWDLNQVHDYIVGECNINWTGHGSASGDIILSAPSGVLDARPTSVSIQDITAILPVGFIDGLFANWSTNVGIEFQGYNAAAGTYHTLDDGEFTTNGSLRLTATWFV